MERIGFVNWPNGVVPTHVTTCVVNAYLNLEHLQLFWKLNVIQHSIERKYFYDVLQKGLFDEILLLRCGGVAWTIICIIARHNDESRSGF